jgi:hypothetical protein
MKLLQNDARINVSAYAPAMGQCPEQINYWEENRMNDADMLEHYTFDAPASAPTDVATEDAPAENTLRRELARLVAARDEPTNASLSPRGASVKLLSAPRSRSRGQFIKRFVPCLRALFSYGKAFFDGRDARAHHGRRDYTGL